MSGGEWIRGIIERALDSVALNVSIFVATIACLAMPRYFLFLPRVPAEHEWWLMLLAVFFGVLALIRLTPMANIRFKSWTARRAAARVKAAPFTDDERELLIDLARHTSIHLSHEVSAEGRPRVLGAVHGLVARGLVKRNPAGYVSLTAEGEAAAVEVSLVESESKRK